MTTAWSNMPDKLSLDFVTSTLVNLWRTNLKALKENFEAEHSWTDGTHTRRRFRAYATGVNTGLVPQSSFNVGAMSHVATGWYRFYFVDDVTGYTGCVAGIQGINTDDLFVVTELASDHCDVYVHDSDDAAFDLTLGNFISLVVV